MCAKINAKMPRMWRDFSAFSRFAMVQRTHEKPAERIAYFVRHRGTIMPQKRVNSFRRHRDCIFFRFFSKILLPCVGVGHEATDTGLAYAPVSPAHGHQQ